MSRISDLALKVGVSVATLTLAALRIVKPTETSAWLDTTFLLLIMAPVLAFLVPWRRLTAFKAAGIELVLEAPSVRGAIAGIEMSASENRRIRRTLYELSVEIDASSGSRVIWIDDHPEEVLGERRLIRSLGIQVVSANSTQAAIETLVADNDFDLMISDIQRKTEPGSTFQRYGGIEFVQRIRQDWEDEVVQSLAIIFYTAYKPDQIAKVIEQVGAEPLQDVHYCGTIEGLIRGIFRILPGARAEATIVRSKKKATDIT